MNKKPLPNRFHIVVTTQKLESNNETVIFVDSIESAYQKAFEVIQASKAIPKNTDNKLNVTTADTLSRAAWHDEVIIIGGAQIYKQTLMDCRKLYLTFIDKTFSEADSHYPSEFQKFFTRTSLTPSEQHPEVIYSTWERSDIPLR